MLKSQKKILAVGAVLVLVLILGGALRLLDLDDPPLDFNPTRQLRSAIISRGIYYQAVSDADPQTQDLAISHMNAMERLEPPVFETIVAGMYRLGGGENLAVARVLASLFWLIGAVFLFDLGRRMTSPWAALVGVGIFLFLPFSVRASRSFQPDPGMVTLIILTAWALYRWQDDQSWNWAILAGFFGGTAILIKFVALFFIAGVTIGTAGYVLGFQNAGKDDKGSKWQIKNLKSGFRNLQIYGMAALMITPALVYYGVGLSTPNSGSFLHWTVINRWREILVPSFYMRWMVFLDDLLGLALIMASLLGALVTTSRNRALLLGLCLGYFLFGLFFPYHILTHDYYHLPLIAILSLSLMPLLDAIIQKVTQQPRGVQVMLFFVILGFMVYNGWMARSILVGQDYREHPTFWQQVGEIIPVEAKAVGLTQDYGFRLMYYGWRKIDLWPQNAQPQNLPQMAPDADFFVVTAKNQLSDQLENYLNENYPVFAQGPGYLIFSLSRHP
jgi:hypothetical protein